MKKSFICVFLAKTGNARSSRDIDKKNLDIRSSLNNFQNSIYILRKNFNHLNISAVIKLEGLEGKIAKKKMRQVINHAIFNILLIELATKKTINQKLKRPALISTISNILPNKLEQGLGSEARIA